MRKESINLTQNGCFNIDYYIKKVINEAAKDCKIMENSTELRLSKMFRIAFKNEDFKTCAEIKKEIENRISKGTIDKEIVNELDLSGLNGLFDNYKFEENAN